MNLILQAVILVILGLAIIARLKHGIVKHAALMGGGLALHTISIGAIMIPSLLSTGMIAQLKKLTTNLALLTMVHATVGSVVEIMGIILLATWLSNITNTQKCFKRKNIMRITITLWLTEIILGILLYMTLYPIT